MTLRGQLHVSPRGRRWHPELALAHGPAGEGVTGDGSLDALYGRPWALVWDVTRPELVLCQVVGGLLEPVEPLAPLPALTRPARHIALAFDPAARPIIAWQGREGVYVRQYDFDTAAYVVRGPFAGHDPVLIPDAVIRRDVGGSDVVLGHLTDDRSQLVARLERDLYGTVYPLAELTPAPSGRPWYLDQVTALPWRLQWILATDELTAETRSLPADQQRLERVVYQTELYGIEAADAAGVSASGISGTLQATTKVETAGDSAGVAAALSGTLQATTQAETAGDSAEVAAALSGTLQATTQAETAGDSAEVAAALSGTLQTTTRALENDDAAAVTAALRGELRHVA